MLAIVGLDGEHPRAVDSTPQHSVYRESLSRSSSLLKCLVTHPEQVVIPASVLSLPAPGREPRGAGESTRRWAGEEVDLIMRWTGYTGRYLLHCHNLEHQDHSMMARVDVV